MKKILTLMLVLGISMPAMFAQGRPEGNDEGWKERVNAQKIAYITMELELTTEEAQAFWPVYNKFSAQNAELGSAVMTAFRELGKALKDNEDVEAKLDAYTKALDARTTNNVEAAKEYKKVLPVEKVAKLFMADEKFRFQQIERLHNGGPAGNQPAPQDGKRPGKGPQFGHGPQMPPQDGPRPENGPQHEVQE